MDRKENMKRLQTAGVIVGTGALGLFCVIFCILALTDQSITYAVLSMLCGTAWGGVRMWAMRDGDPDPDLDL